MKGIFLKDQSLADFLSQYQTCSACRSSAAYTNRTGPCRTRFPLQNCTCLPLPIVKYIQMTTQAEFPSCPNVALFLVVCSLANSVCTRLQMRPFVSSHVKILVKTNAMLQGFSSTQGYAFSSWGASITV